MITNTGVKLKKNERERVKMMGREIKRLEKMNENSFLEQRWEQYVCHIKYGMHYIDNIFKKRRDEEGDFT